MGCLSSKNIAARMGRDMFSQTTRIRFSLAVNSHRAVKERDARSCLNPEFFPENDPCSFRKERSVHVSHRWGVVLFERNSSACQPPVGGLSPSDMCAFHGGAMQHADPELSLRGSIVMRGPASSFLEMIQICLFHRKGEVRVIAPRKTVPY